MKLGVMQPYFFPYLGYFELIRRTDHWVVFDTAQYTRKSWMNRNRIHHPTSGWQYIHAPVRHTPLGSAIRSVQLMDRQGARDRLLSQLAHYRGHAPHYRQVQNVVGDAFSQSFSRTGDDSLLALDIATLASVCAYLELPFHWQLASDIDLGPLPVEHPGQWALRIAARLGASEYLNPPGGRHLFQVEEWRAAGIRLRFTNLPTLRYACHPYSFIEHLSILDVLMWCSPAQVCDALSDNPLDG